MFQIMTFMPNGNPTPIENKKYTTKEKAEKRMQELKKIYNAPMRIKEVK